MTVTRLDLLVDNPKLTNNQIDTLWFIAQQIGTNIRNTVRRTLIDKKGPYTVVYMCAFCKVEMSAATKRCPVCHNNKIKCEIF